MILKSCRKPFAVLCLLLAASSYVSAIPISINNISGETAFLVLQDNNTHVEVKPSLNNQNDIDIKDKDIREEVKPIRRSYEQRLRPH